jgi:hypothetical protein
MLAPTAPERCCRGDSAGGVPATGRHLAPRRLQRPAADSAAAAGGAAAGARGRARRAVDTHRRATGAQHTGASLSGHAKRFVHTARTDTGLRGAEQTESLLGPAFSLSALPDGMSRPAPDVMAQCFAGCEARSQAEVGRPRRRCAMFRAGPGAGLAVPAGVTGAEHARAVGGQLRMTHDALRATMGQIHDALHRLAMTFLRSAVRPGPAALRAAPGCRGPSRQRAGPARLRPRRAQDTREDMLRWLAAAIEANVERSKSMVPAAPAPARPAGASAAGAAPDAASPHAAGRPGALGQPRLLHQPQRGAAAAVRPLRGAAVRQGVGQAGRRVRAHPGRGQPPPTGLGGRGGPAQQRPLARCGPGLQVRHGQPPAELCRGRKAGGRV